jgi:hypothetical protein
LLGRGQLFFILWFFRIGNAARIFPAAFRNSMADRRIESRQAALAPDFHSAEVDECNTPTSTYGRYSILPEAPATKG